MLGRSKFAIFDLSRISNPQGLVLLSLLQLTASISSLKVVWRKDPKLDQAIENDKKWRLCARVAREVLNEPGQVIPLRYLKKRRERLRLPDSIEVILVRYPGLFDIYRDRIRPKADLVDFLRPSDRLNSFVEEEKRIHEKNEILIVSKLCKLLMMAKDRVVSADKLVEVKREFGFPNDFLVRLVSKYPEYFQLHGAPGEEKSFLELVSWNDEFAKSIIEKRADEESSLTGIRVRPQFNWKLPRGFLLKKEMRGWIRDWIELPYISPYNDVSHLDQSSPEMEKRSVGVFHELLSLSIYKRVPVPILGKFCEEYRFSNAFSSVFTRHSGIFYMSRKGGIHTAMLREAYNGEELIDRDPLLEIRDKFVELLDEGQQQRSDQLKLQKEMVKKNLELMEERNKELNCHDTKLLKCLNEARLVKSSKNMDGATIALKFPLLAMVLLVLYPLTKGQWAPVNPPPLCASQFALVNHACSKLPYTPLPLPSTPSPPLPPPNPPSPDGSGSRHHSSHGHRHRGHRHRETPIEEECCRWLKEVDSVCVCELLIRLPPFLIKPVHNYTVTVDETCSVTFQCSSSLLSV